MKKACLILSAVVLAGTACAVSISAEDARRVANGFVSERSPLDEDGTRVVKVVEKTFLDGLKYYVAIREGGGAIIISGDNEIDPIVAVVSSVLREDKTVDESCPVWDMASCGYTNRIRSVYGGRKSLMVPRSRQTQDDARKERTMKKWERYLNETNSVQVFCSSSGVPALKSRYGQRYVIDGFETGGRFTHWGQTVAKTGFNGTMPCYNYYMHSDSTGGTDADGLKIVSNASIPCGCAATAYSVACQVLGAKGLIASPSYRTDVKLPARNIYGELKIIGARPIGGIYNWDLLPENYGGKAPAVSSEAEFTKEMRELLGRVTYNAGLSLKMDYGLNESGAVAKGYIGGVSSMFGAKIWSDSINGYGCYDELISYEESGSPKKFPLERIHAYVKAGVPVIALIAGESGGHAVNVVGTYDDDREFYVKLFMGWNGMSDSWVKLSDEFSVEGFSEILGFVFPSAGSSATVPLFAKCSGNMTVSNCDSSVSFVVIPDSEGTARCLIPCRGQDEKPNYEPLRICISDSTGSRFVDIQMTNDADSAFVPYVSESYYKSLPFLLGGNVPICGFRFGTPMDVSLAVKYAFERNLLLAVIVGNGNDDNLLVRTVNGFSDIDRYAVFYVNSEYERRESYIEADGGIGVFDPSVFDSSRFWQYENGRKAFGNFGNAYDIEKVLREGLLR